MGIKSQRQKARKAQKRQEKLKQQKQARRRQQSLQNLAEIPLGSNTRHRQRLAEQIPQSWEGEAAHDVAVFDDTALSALPPEFVPQVSAIREALRDATESRGEDAIKRTSVISRSSPLSEWRLFIRGLVDWLAEDTEAAGEAWKRLDSERRPGRIARTMMLALRSDLEQVSPLSGKVEPGDTPRPLPWDCWDEQLLYHAKLVRRIRFDRAALRVAERGSHTPEEASDLLLGPRKIKWIGKFVKEYGDTEPELANALAQTGLRRAYAQDYSNLFEDAARAIPGPRHDPRNQLFSFFYSSRFQRDPAAEKTAERALDQYLTELPKNEAISETLRGAIASQIHYFEAMSSMRPDRGFDMMTMFSPSEDTTFIRKEFRASYRAYPENLSTYKAYVDWLESKLDNDRMTQVKRKPLERELAEVMGSWSEGLPEDIEPRLWLVDHLLENEKLEEAKPHVDFLSTARQDDPRVRATPWKWQLLEAMRLCRRKAWLAEVPARLDQAESLWPAWLPKQWLAYLRAAWMLRGGQTEAFENQRQRICQESGRTRDSLADACMMLGAAQKMRVPGDDLKRLRAPVDQMLKNFDKLSLDELVEAGGFFWDLHRTRLVYPAYRMHGGKFGKALLERWERSPKQVLEGFHEERIQKAVLWCSEYRFWSSRYEASLPPVFSRPPISRDPMIAAAKLNSFLKSRYYFGSEQHQELGLLLREAAETQRDVFYRHWFLALATELDDVLANQASRFSGFPFGDMFGGDGDFDYAADADEGEFEGEDLDFDPNCDCPICQAARRAYEKSRASNSRMPY